MSLSEYASAPPPPACGNKKNTVGQVMIDPFAISMWKDPKVPKFLVFGEPGTGRSTLISHIDREHAARIAVGDSVTKVINIYVCKHPNGAYFILIDTPGFGDGTIPPQELLVQMETALKTTRLHGVLIVLDKWTRINIGSRLMSRVIALAFKGDIKWNNIIYTFSHADVWGPKNLKSNIALNKKLAEANIAAGVSRFACIAQPPDGTVDLSELHQQLEEVMKAERIWPYYPPTSDDFAEAISATLGPDTTGLAEKKELGIAIDKYRDDIQRLTDQMKEAMEQQANLQAELKEEQHRAQMKDMAQQQEIVAKEEEYQAFKRDTDAKLAQKTKKSWIQCLGQAVATVVTLGLAVGWGYCTTNRS